MKDHKYLNAINAVIEAQLDVLLRLEKQFDGDWLRAWEYIKKELKSKLDPDKLWQVVLKHKLDIITILDKTYPDRLRSIPHPPPIL